ncbi:hypothetical protein [Kribbella sp. HUAS MG21]|uniref:Uncharacterized protein n=1 Tax=Kribbella sp. HUAS MG21 TaxID=3160966 RepID=A0AAU7TF19_9ACTN
MAALATGLAAAARGRSLRQRWVLTKLAITTALTLLVVLTAEPGLASAATGLVTDRTRTTYAVVPVVTAALLLVNVVLGVRHRIPEVGNDARAG